MFGYETLRAEPLLCEQQQTCAEWNETTNELYNTKIMKEEI